MSYKDQCIEWFRINCNNSKTIKAKASKRIDYWNGNGFDRYQWVLAMDNLIGSYVLLSEDIIHFAGFRCRIVSDVYCQFPYECFEVIEYQSDRSECELYGKGGVHPVDKNGNILEPPLWQIARQYNNAPAKQFGWPKEKDVRECCGIWGNKDGGWPTKINVKHLNEFSCRAEFNAAFKWYVKIEDMPNTHKVKERVLDPFTAMALKNYPSNGDRE